ncbi:MAG: hypothetical protein WCF85_18705 [Rhodospirillaceae bacterium]
MSKLMSPYTVLWRDNARYLIGSVDGVVTKTSPLVKLDEVELMATTRSGSIYQLRLPSDAEPPISYTGVIEIPLVRFALCSIRGRLSLVGTSPSERPYLAQVAALDRGACLCRANDGRMLRWLGRPTPGLALSALTRLAPSLSLRDVELYDAIPDDLGQDWLWQREETSDALRTRKWTVSAGLAMAGDDGRVPSLH